MHQCLTNISTESSRVIKFAGDKQYNGNFKNWVVCVILNVRQNRGDGYSSALFYGLVLGNYSYHMFPSSHNFSLFSNTQLYHIITINFSQRTAFILLRDGNIYRPNLINGYSHAYMQENGEGLFSASEDCASYIFLDYEDVIVWCLDFAHRNHLCSPNLLASSLKAGEDGI